MRNGILAAFAEANQSPAKGVRSRKLLLLSLDDSYSDVQARINARELIANQSLVAVVGAVGADPTLAMMPLYQAAGIPLVGTNSGDRSLRNSWAINVRAFYDDEAAAMVDFVLSRGLRRISLFRQMAAFGQSGADALDLVLRYNKLQLHTVSGHPRGVAPDYPGALFNLTRGGVPEAVILYVSVSIATTFIQKAMNDSAWANTLFICGSISDVDRFPGRLPPAALQSGRVFSSAVVPAVGNDTFSQDYLRALRLIDSRLFFGKPFAPTLASLEGYLIGRLVIAALARVTEFTGAALLADIHATQGITINNFKLGPYTDECNMGLRSVYIVRVDNETMTQVSEFRPQSHNTFLPQCGAFSLYNTNFSCPPGYMLEYVDEASLDSICKLCLSPYGCNAGLEHHWVFGGSGVYGDCGEISQDGNDQGCVSSLLSTHFAGVDVWLCFHLRPIPRDADRRVMYGTSVHPQHRLVFVVRFAICQGVPCDSDLQATAHQGLPCARHSRLGVVHWSWGHVGR
jgi:ABC-type branched-subunit amino acid transport system substrate-binding protein